MRAVRNASWVTLWQETLMFGMQAESTGHLYRRPRLVAAVADTRSLPIR